MSACGGCPSDTRFVCKWGGKEVCLRKERYQCDGIFYCDDGNDEAPSLCSNCTLSGLHMCRDGSRCVKTKGWVDLPEAPKIQALPSTYFVELNHFGELSGLSHWPAYD